MKRETCVPVNPEDMRFLRDRTGADTNEEVVVAALQLYKVAVLGALDSKRTALVRKTDDGVWEIAPIELPQGQFAYAVGNADVQSIAKGDVDCALRTVLQDTRKAHIVPPEPEHRSELV